jgi:hypothetical protein
MAAEARSERMLWVCSAVTDVEVLTTSVLPHHQMTWSKSLNVAQEVAVQQWHMHWLLGPRAVAANFFNIV